MRHVDVFSRIRLLAKNTLQRLHLAAGMIEFCKDCGKRQPLIWHANNLLWQRLADTKGVLCPHCFSERAQQHGMFLFWVPVNEAGRTAALAADCWCGEHTTWLCRELDGEPVVEGEICPPCWQRRQEVRDE